MEGRTDKRKTSKIEKHAWPHGKEVAMRPKWLVVQFIEDGKISSVLKACRVDTVDGGQNGQEADLKDGEICLAPWKSSNYEYNRLPVHVN